MKKTGRTSAKEIIKAVLFGFAYPVLYRCFCLAAPAPDQVLLLELRFGKLSDNLAPYRHYYQKRSPGKLRVLCLGTENRNALQQFRLYVKMFRTLSRARLVYVTESSNVLAAVKIRKETSLVQVWHACGAFKRFGYGLPDAPQEPYYNEYDLVPVSGKRVVEIYRQSMHQKEGAVKALGVARTDMFFDRRFLSAAAEKVHSVIRERPGAAADACRRKIVLFAPTFRGNVAAAQMPEMQDLETLYDAWHERAVVLYKGHPAVAERPAVPEEYRDFFLDVTDVLPTECLIAAADLLITDYSSVIFDYSLFGRPMLFYAYDLAQYDDGRGFYSPYEAFVPGPVCRNSRELADSGMIALDGCTKNDKVKQFREDYMGACDGHSLKRIIGMADPR